MASFNLEQPTRIWFGRKSFEKLGDVVEQVEPSRVLVVVGGSSMKKSGFLDKALDLIESETVEVYEGVEADPSVETVDAICEESFGCDAIVGLGGGSVLDAAKAAAVIAKNSGDTREHLDGISLRDAGIPFIAVPSTAGSGSEVTRASVLTDPEKGVKRTLRSPLMFPHSAIVDPALTVSCPPKLTAAVGIDALTHALESYTSQLANPVSDGYALESTTLILKVLEKACEDGENTHSRANMALGSLLAGLALNAASSGVAHRIAHGIGGRFHAPHGEILAMLLPHILEYNMPDCEKKMTVLSKHVGMKTPGKLVEKIREMTLSMELPQTLSDFGASMEDIPWLVEQSFTSSSIRYNARKVAKEELSNLLSSML